MQNLISLLEARAREAIAKALGTTVTAVEVTPSTQVGFGDYQCNQALKLAKELGKNPREIATAIVDHFHKGDEIAKLEIAGAGFINITLSPQFLSRQIDELLRDPRLGVPYPHKIEKIVVEFSSPNTAKELHVGHLRSTIIGDALARLFEFLGHDVVRLNHVGDWGTQFGMLIAYMREEASDVLTGTKTTDLSHLMGWYKAAKQKFDDDLEFKKRAQLEVVKLQGGDEASLAAWQVICDISRRGYQQIYDLLDIRLTERGESFYNSYLPDIVADLEKRTMVTLSEGAKCIYLDEFRGRDGNPFPIIIQKADGGYNYDTTDMAALRHRIEVERASRLIYVVDAGQSLHFLMIFRAAEKAGYLNPLEVRAEHVPFGVVLGPDGKKYKSRSGETEKLIDLIHEAVAYAKKILSEKIDDLSGPELDEAAKILGIDALKYADLASHRIKDYVFSYERMLRFEGNTAAFLLYAFVRIQGIKRKVGKPIDVEQGGVLLEHPTEVALALHLRRFGEVLEQMSAELLPNRLADYLYTLAEKFHAFFRDCRVEGSPEEKSRLLLCEATGRILKQGLDILGLKTLSKM
jgi:arginyl-tRNA synthetase